jgi:release factor glutamine methyltransferase
MTVREALNAVTADLAGTSDTPRLDAELLMAHALGIERGRMLLAGLDGVVPDGFGDLIARRRRHEPVAYIVGTRDFWTITLAVAPGVLIPRPDSETLIEAAVAHFAGTSGPRTVLDLGTGSGALLLAALAEWPEAEGVGIDASSAALAIAAANAERLGMGARTQVQPGGWQGTGEAFDLVLCNPPYIADAEPLAPDVAEYEPASALFAGEDGLDDYRRIAPIIARQIAPGGVACVEIGSTQGQTAAALFVEAGLRVGMRQDLAGRDRCLVVRHG